MGLLQQGRWVNDWYDLKTPGAVFKGQGRAFRAHVVAPAD